MKRKRKQQVPADIALAEAKSKLLKEGVSEFALELRKVSKAACLEQSFNSVVVFAQYECGTGVNISEAGLILTCAHCLGDHPKVGIQRSVIFTSGLICLARATKVDVLRDTALMTIVGAYDSSREFDDSPRIFPSTSLAATPPALKAVLVCIGQPGSDDLESSSRRKTDYPIVSISKGQYLGCIDGLHSDNSEIGRLMHSCWTYWGHSGGPLLDATGCIVGLHSSWDDETGTRHGIHLDALTEFVA